MPIAKPEDSEHKSRQLPKEPGPHKVNLEDHLQELFDLDVRVASSEPSLLPLESPQELLDFLTKEHKSDTYIWNDDTGQLAGFFSIIDPLGDPEFELLNVGIDPGAQGQGIGKKIMAYTEDLARNSGKEKIKLVTNVKNTSAQKFYEKVGYHIAKTIDNYYGDGETRVLMEKEIK